MYAKAKCLGTQLQPGVGLEGLFLAVEYPDLSWKFMYSFLFVCFFVFVFCLFRAAPEAYGGSQARGLIRAVAAGLHHSHSNGRSKPSLIYAAAYGNAGSSTH